MTNVKTGDMVEWVPDGYDADYPFTATIHKIEADGSLVLAVDDYDWISGTDTPDNHVVYEKATREQIKEIH